MKKLVAVAGLGGAFAFGLVLRPPLQTLVEVFNPVQTPQCLDDGEGTRMCVGMRLADLRIGRGYVLTTVVCEPTPPDDLLDFPRYLVRQCPGMQGLFFKRGARFVSVRLRDGRVSAIQDAADVTLP